MNCEHCGRPRVMDEPDLEAKGNFCWASDYRPDRPDRLHWLIDCHAWEQMGHLVPADWKPPT